MDSFDSKMTQSNTYWWITSLAISVVCCSVLFVVFASYLFQIKEDLAIAKIRFDITESRLNEMSIDLQMLNRRTTVQQIQIIPSGNTQVQPAAGAEPISPAAAAATAVTQPSSATPAPAEPPVPTPAPVPAKH